ncbi:hypothetical protein BpHYR1_047792 [Brachionus plicatilis]|uniref:Uncharacterized protein n=1 Tax=Brachionus plicatilis TaxID=10195 RepID=A0A3M7S990_BRAPC|nr:hypothetical protein BpHYR1_047792 [Brachionus plicatilis]
METQIKIKEDSIKRWRSRGLNLMVQYSEAFLAKLRDNRQLCAQKEQLQSVNQGVEQLGEENAELRGLVEQDEPLKCPVCLEVYTSCLILLSHVVQPVLSANDRARQ